MPQALERLRAMRQAHAAADSADLSPKSPKSPGMTLAEFAGSGQVVALHSDVMGEEVIFAADNARLAEDETRPVYRARELSGLTDWSADGLRLLHEVKTRFGAEVQAEPEEGKPE